MWDWNILFGRKIEASPLIEKNLKCFCSDSRNDEDHKFQSDSLVRKWLRDCTDEFTVVCNTSILREAKIDSPAASIPCIDLNNFDHRNLKDEHYKSTSKYDVTEDLSRLSRSGTEHERTPAAPDEPPKELLEKKISCFSFGRRK